MTPVAMSAKYPRTFHLPWSPGGTSDDKRLPDAVGLVGVEIVITEKLDGSNLTFTRSSVFARSHGGPPTHPSFARAKAIHASIAHLVPVGLSVFAEYCYAVHSIVYDGLPEHVLIFGVREDARARWWSWDETTLLAEDLGLPTVPALFRGVVATPRELERTTTTLAAKPSTFGGAREGVVVRIASAIEGEGLAGSVGKWVRRGHVQTDEHWLHQAIVPQRLMPRDDAPV